MGEVGSGRIVLPTGTGKTHVANLAIEMAKRPALVVTPTIDLMNQWYDELSLSFATEVGLAGGGYNDIKPLTVTTYDSALYQHGPDWQQVRSGSSSTNATTLPGPTYGMAAIASMAPWRLGLTATPERADNAHPTRLPDRSDRLSREITQLRGQYLADYRVETVYVNLSDAERNE